MKPLDQLVHFYVKISLLSFKKKFNFFLLDFYPQNFHHLVKALEAYITAEQQSVKGILRIVNAFFSAVTNPEFTYTETTFALPSSNVIEIQNGMNQWAAANQQIVNASQLFVYAFNGTLLYQNNGNSKWEPYSLLIKNLFIFYQNLQH